MAKLSQVRSERVWLQPTAYCRGVLEHNPEKYGHDTREVVVPCNAQFQGVPAGSTEVGVWARKHAADNPGHEVIWEKREVAVYWVDPPEEGT